MAGLFEVNEQNFQQVVLESGHPVLVDFWATWCSSCHALTPKLEEISNELQGRAKIVKVNAEECTGLAARYGVRGLPAMVIVKNGELRATLQGNLPKERIREALESLL